MGLLFFTVMLVIFTLNMELAQCNNYSVYNFEVASEFLEDLYTPGLVITPICRRLCVVNSSYGNTSSTLYFPDNSNNSNFFRVFVLTSDFSAINSHFVHNNERLKQDRFGLTHVLQNM
jgi:hypothetical protein